MITILARIMSNHDFITCKVKMGMKELGNDVYSKNITFHIVETDEIHHKRTSSFKTYKLQDQLAIVKFGARCKTFSKI
jgi:hypothetical protein